MKNGIRVLRLQKGHKYCVLGRLSSEVGWSYYDTIRVSSCFLSFCFPNISNVYFLQHILIWSHCSFWKTIYLFAIYLLLLLWLCKIYGFWEYGWPPLESCFSLFNLKGEWKLYCWNFCVCWHGCFYCSQELEKKRKGKAELVYARKKQLNKLRVKAEKVAEEKLGSQLDVLAAVKYWVICVFKFLMPTYYQIELHFNLA